MWLKDGQLVRFEVHIEGVVRFTSGSPAFRDGLAINYTRMTTFDERGTAEFSIDPDARAALDQPATATAPVARPVWPRRLAAEGG